MLRGVLSERIAQARFQELSSVGPLYYPHTSPPSATTTKEKVSPLNGDYSVPLDNRTLFNISLVCFLEHITSYIEFSPVFVSSYISSLPCYYTSLLSSLISENKGMNDDIIEGICYSNECDQIALWGNNVTDKGIEMLLPTLLPPDDMEWEEEGDAVLRGFTCLSRLEICDTPNVKLKTLIKLLNSNHLKLTLEYISFRKCAGLHEDDSETDWKSHREFVDCLITLTSEGKLKGIDLRECWLWEGCLGILRKGVGEGVRILC